jgi:hypothetical protein
MLSSSFRASIPKRASARRRLAKARERTVREHDSPELAITNGSAPSIKENPPLIYHWRESGHEERMSKVRAAYAAYRERLPKIIASYWIDTKSWIKPLEWLVSGALARSAG